MNGAHVSDSPENPPTPPTRASAEESAGGIALLAELWDDERVPAGFATATRERRRWPGVVAMLVVVALLAVAGWYAAYAVLARAPQAAIETRTPVVVEPEPATFRLPSTGSYAVKVSGGGGIFGDADDGAAGFTLSQAPERARPIASITKLITALVVLDARPLDDADDPGPTLHFDRADHALYDKYYVRNATIARMPTGSSMTLREALQMMLVISASNYAEAVANWAFGGPWGYTQAVERWLAEYGLDDTTIVEPTGIDPRNTSSPADLVRIGELAMKNPAIATIVGMPHLDVEGHSGANTNTLLGQNGVRGLKTGTLNSSGANLLFQAELAVGPGEPVIVTGAVLGGPSRAAVDSQVNALLDSIRAGYRPVTVARGGNRVGTYTTPWGAEADIVLERDAVVHAWSDAHVASAVTLTALPDGPALPRGTVMGEATFTAGDRTERVPVVLDADVEAPDTWWRLTHLVELDGWP